MHATPVVATEAVDIHVVFDEQMACPRALKVDYPGGAVCYRGPFNHCLPLLIGHAPRCGCATSQTKETDNGYVLERGGKPITTIPTADEQCAAWCACYFLLGAGRA